MNLTICLYGSVAIVDPCLLLICVPLGAFLSHPMFGCLWKKGRRRNFALKMAIFVKKRETYTSKEHL